MAPETPRGVSSRLLTMKFMQRAAASASSAGSPDSDAPSSKKRKVGHSPSVGRIDTAIDQAAIKAALDDQEAKRQAALAQHTGADTHWVLSNAWTSQAKPEKAPLNIVYVGYGDIDSSNESGDNEDAPAKGRTSTTDYKKSKPKAQASQDNNGHIPFSETWRADNCLQKVKTEDESDSSDDSSDEDSDEQDTPSAQRKRKHSSDSRNPSSDRSRSRSASRPRQSLESAKAKEFREKRKKKEVRLNKLTSISNAGGDKQFGARSSPSSKGLTCYKCQQPGHRAVECPLNGGSRGRSQR